MSMPKAGTFLTMALLIATASPCFAAQAPVVPLESLLGRVERIESAYRAGLEKATLPEERTACARIRYASLAGLVEIAYESTLAWLAESDALLRAMQDDQGRWLAERDGLVKNAAFPAETADGDLDKASSLMLERLRFLVLVTAES